MSLFSSEDLMTKQRHHYIPQFYLKNFADPANQKIWLYTKTGERCKAASPRDVGIEKDYHTVIRRDGVKDRNTIEDTVGSLENVAAPVIQKILHRTAMTFDDYQIFVVFVAQMLLRVPARRDAAGRMISEILKHVAKSFAANKESYHDDYRRFQKETGDTSDLDPEKLRQFILGDDYGLKVNSSVALGLSLSAIDIVTKCLLRMRWVFLRRRGRFQVITCDNPVFYCDPTIPPNTWHGVGLMNRGIEVSFPPSPDIVAFASYHSKPRNQMDIGPEVVRRFNQQTIDSAHRYIFAAEESSALERFISRNNDSTLPVQQYLH